MEETYTTLSYSALSNITGLVAMLSAWFFVRHRIKQSDGKATRSVILMRNFFLLFGIFYLFLSIPFYALYFDPEQFGIAMAVGFTIGHVFLFAAMTQTLRLTTTIVPRLYGKERIATLLGAVSVVWIFAVSTITMVFGNHPVYDYVRHIVDYQQEPILANTIAAGAFIAWVPLGILFLVNAFKSHGWQRLRSSLLGLGFLVLTVAGPLHGLAQNFQQLLVADLVTIVALVMIGTGIVIKISASLERPDKKPVPAAQISLS